MSTALAAPTRRLALPIGAWRLLVAVAVVAGLAVFPYLDVPLYYVRFLSSVFLYITLAQSWNIIGGYTGYVSFGHVTFFGIGAYVSALLFRDFRVSPLIAVFPAGVVAAAFGMLVGYPTLRLRGPYFGIATLALSLVTMLVVANVPFTNGGEGINVRGALPFLRVALEQAFYLSYLALALATFATTLWLEHSKFGFGLRAIRDDQDVALSVGVNATRLKVLAFGLSSFFAGAAGALYAHQASFVSPGDVFTLSISFKSLVYAVIGGTSTVLGPVLGATFMEVFNTLLTISPLGTAQVDRIVFGIVLVVVVLAAPSGMVGLLTQVWRAARRRF
ncbi:MAG: branched-chain amino acid ABC transporter permease [Chloroflexota bacterium]|nr:branched-chain amino acid ABC transporter permease [Chloroflexota bacterium]